MSGHPQATQFGNTLNHHNISMTLYDLHSQT